MSNNVSSEYKKCNVNFKALIIAFIFLFNANINIIDVIPDIIGYVILLLAIVRLADLNDDIAVAYKYFRYMIVVEISKFLAFLWVFGLSRTDEHNTGLLLLTFAFAVVDSIILFAAFNKLFSGLISLGYKHTNTSVLGSIKKNGRSYTEKIRALTLFFIIFRAAMAVLPEFSNLTTYEYDETSRVVYLYEYIGLLRAISFIVVTVVGLIWLVKVIRYFLRVSRDIDFVESLKNDYVTNILPKKHLFIRRNITMVFFLFVAAAVFMMDFRLQQINVLPDTVGAILFLLGFICLTKYTNIKKSVLYILASVYCVTSITAYLYEIFFFSKYYYGAVYRSVQAYRAYSVMCAISAVNLCAFALLIGAFIYSLRCIIYDHTGYVYGTDAERDAKRLEVYHKESEKKLILILVAGVLMLSADIFHTFFAVKFEVTGAITSFAGLIFIAAVIKVTQDISEETETKYMLD